MACPAIITGDQFLSRVLEHIDCQAQVIGSYGYLALGQPGSLASTLVTALLTLFIAFFGIRLLFGPQPGARDLVMDVIKIGIVLTLAFSWPAFRTLVYDVTLKGPAEIVSAIQAGAGQAAGTDLPVRLQTADNRIAELTALGTGRNTGQLIESEASGESFASTALEDDAAFGSARLVYLASVIGSLGLLRIGAGILLALAPIVAGLYLFTQTRGIFAGWLKALVFTIGGSIAATLVLSVQLAMLEPWLADAVRIRSLGYATPSAPTELFALMLGFLILQLGVLALLARIAFHRSWLTLPDLVSPTPFRLEPAHGQSSVRTVRDAQVTLRAERISSSIESTIRRERTIQNGMLSANGQATTSSPGQSSSTQAREPRLGSSFRRSSLRSSRAAQVRDHTP
jgi:type IV secretion system protein VirB6